ncbi:hypothetical protein BW737_003690 [Actinomyces ruminis]|uniref:DeoR-like transcriptional repressor C-terminal sensor domain-containing protein n=1 Tax=Actinomyces ruminis TaxID=1937003 RepID=A0ABX4MCQ8_9ACTO|nr:hypothetical protein BW737_003690 [Actinomyces ruminis]
MGTSGVRADGMVLDSTGIEVPVKHALRAAAERTCLLATADKFPGSGLLPVCPITELDVVITTAAPGVAPLPELAGANTEVLFA